MKITTFLFVILFIGGIVLVAVSNVAQDTSSYYGVDVNTSLFADKYNYMNEINSSVDPLINSLDDISSQDKGWLEIGVSGFTGIIKAITLIPSILWQSFKLAGAMVTGGLVPIGVPAGIIGVIMVALIIWGVFKLLEGIHRWPW